MHAPPNATNASARRVAAWSTIVAFVALTLAPAFDLIARPDEARSPLRENRRPAPPPEPVTDLDSLSRRPARFEAWFGDRLGLRDVLLRGSQALRYFVFHSEPSPTLVPGKDGWLFFGSDESVPTHRGVAPLTRADLELWRKTLEAERDWCRRVGAEFVFAIGPNKQTVYPEKWPDELDVVGPTRLEQFLEYMRRESDVRVVDLRPALAKEREHDSVERGDYTYFPLGSHWTWRGAWAGWNAIAASLPEELARRLHRPRERFRAVELPDSLRDSMGQQTYIGDLLVQHNWGWIADDTERVVYERDADGKVVGSRVDDPSLPTAMIVHDSFGPWFLENVGPCFSRMHAVWAHAFPKEAVAEVAPDLVVQIYTERMLVWGIQPLSPDVDRVSAAEFARFAPGFGPLAAATSPPPVVEGGVSVEVVDGAWVFDQRLENGVILLPPCDVKEGSELALHVDVTAPSHTRLTVFFQTRAEPSFSRRRAVTQPLEAGRNDLHFRVRVPDVTGPIKVRIGGESGRYVVHAVEARCASTP